MPHFPLRFSVWEWIQTALLGANLAWTTVCLGGYRAETMVVTSLLTALLLLVHAGQVLFSSARPQRVHPAGWLFIPFLAYAAANVAWVTPVRWLGWIDWFGWAQMIAVFWVVLNGVRSGTAVRALWAVLFSLAVIGVLLACYQRFVRPDWLMLHRVQADQYLGRASGPFGIPNSFAALLLLLLPPAGALAFRRRAAAIGRVFFGWLLLVLVLGLVLTISRGAWLGLAAALSVWPLLRGGSWRRRVISMAMIVVALVLAGGTVFLASPRSRERLTQLARDVGERSRPILWRAGWTLFQEHPAVGTGGGSYDTLFEQYRPEGFLNQPQWAHNDYLNTLTDYGVVGFVLFFGAAGVVVLRSRLGERRSVGDALDDRLVREAQAIGILAFALQLFVDFHFKIPALAMSFAIVSALAVRKAWPMPGPNDAGRGGDVPAGRRTRGAASLVALACVGAAIAIVVAIVPLYRAEAWREAARERIDALRDEPLTSPRYREGIARARAEIDRAVALAPMNAQAWADRSYAAAQWSRIAPADAVALGAAAERDADRALALAPVRAEFWIRRGVARDLLGRWTEAGDDFARAIRLSPKLPLPWFHYAYHLALRPTELAMAEAMVATCLRLDPQNPEAQRLRQHLAAARSRP